MKKYKHPPNCTGCPDCDPIWARTITMSPRQLGEVLAMRTAADRTAAMRTHAGGKLACTCAGGTAKPDTRERQIAAVLDSPLALHYDEATLRAMSAAELVEVTADAILASHVPDPWGLERHSDAQQRSFADHLLNPVDPWALPATAGGAA